MPLATRSLVALLTGLLALPVAPSQAEMIVTPATPDAVNLAGVTSFTTSRSGRWRLHVPRDVALKDLRVSYGGNGRVVAFVVIEQGEPLGTGALLGGYSVGRCHRRACEARSPYKFKFTANVEGRLEAGRYLVYILADGAPVSLRLEVKSASGRIRARNPESVRAHIATLPTSSTTTSNVYSAGGFAPPDHDSLFGLFGLWLDADAHAASAYGDCFYFRGDAFASEETAFQPGCPTGDGFRRTFVGSDPTRPGEVSLVSARLSTQAPVAAIGGWYAAAATVSARGAVGAWMDVGSE